MNPQTTYNIGGDASYPQLRFKGFQGGWEKHSLGELCAGFQYGMNAAATTYDGHNGYIRITDIDDNSSTYNKDGKVSPSGELTDYYLVRENDILLARTGASTGKSYLYNKDDGRLYFAGFLIRANVNQGDARFVFSQLHTENYWRWVNVMSMRSGQPGINSQEYASFPIHTPSLPEQQLLGTFFSSLDRLLSAEEQKVAKLKQLKAASLQDMFPQEGQSIPKNQIQRISWGVGEAIN